MAEPAFLARMRAIFASERGNQFLLSGNIHDLVHAAALGPEHEHQWTDLGDFLRSRLRSRGHLVLRYHVGEGIAPDEAGLTPLRNAYQRAHGGSWERACTAVRDDPALALILLAEATRLPVGAPVSVVIEHADLLFPTGETAHLHDADRRRLAIARDWLTDQRFLRHNGVLILLAETAAAVNPRLTSLPTLAGIEIPLPEQADRARFLAHLRERHPDTVPDDAAADTLAELSAGMTLRDLQSLFRENAWHGRPVTRAAVLEEVNRLLRGRIGEHIEIIDPPHSMADVLGNTALLQELERQRRLVDHPDPTIAPVGILVAGPNGCGKTFIFTAWAASCQRVVVSLRNLRGSYFGETDRIFQRVRQVLESLGKVIVLIDEADTQFAPPGPQAHETESRLFGNLIRMMGDPGNRGRIVWVLMTARPELLAPDLKRGGRAGLHLPVFDPEGDDHHPFIDRLLQRCGSTWQQLPAEGQAALRERCQRLSAADYNELALQLQAESALGAACDTALLDRLLLDLRPSRDDPQRQAQAAQAVAHCSRRSLLPNVAEHRA